MKSKVPIVDDDAAIVDWLTSLLLGDIESAGACKRMSAQAMVSGTFYPVIVADVRLHTEEQGLEQLNDIRRKAPNSIANRKYRLDAADAEDVLQDAWVLYFEKRGGIQNAPAWLAGTVSNLCRKQIGSSIRAREAFVHVDAIDSVAQATTTHPDRAVALDQAIACLDDAMGDVCELIAMEGCAYGEVSRLTGLPLGSVGPLYVRVKKKMQIASSLRGTC